MAGANVTRLTQSSRQMSIEALLTISLFLCNLRYTKLPAFPN